MTDNAQQVPTPANAAAVGFLLLGISSGLALDICAKWLLGTYPLAQFIFVRSVVGLACLLLFASFLGGLGQLKTRRWGAHLLRTLLATGAMFGFFNGLAHIPLVDALTLGFTAPLMVTALAALFLNEPVGWRRWAAVAIGFIGVLVVLRPGTGLLQPAALGVIAAAFFYACLAISARQLSATESSFAMSIYVVVGPLIVSAVALPGDWVAPSKTDWGLLILAGLCSAIAWIGIVGGYKRASPALLAPLEYLALIGGAAAGYFIWQEVPDIWVVVGGAIIVASGLFVVFRDVKAAISTRLVRTFSVSGLNRRRR